MRLSAVICTYDRYDVLPEAIRALARQGLAAEDMEIMVIDNSPDAKHSAAEARKQARVKNLTWVHETRPGLSNARNVAMAQAKGEIIAFVDDDAFAVEGWAAAMLDAFATLGPEVAAIGGRVVPQFRAARPAWLSDRLLSYLSMVDLGEETRLLGEGEWVVGANLAYRAEALRATGGFSTSLGRIGNAGLLSAEETEVAAKLTARGLKIGYAPKAQVAHLVDESRTSQGWFARRVAWQAVSAVLSGEAGSDRDLAHAAEEIRRYFAALHPADRHVGALLSDQEKPGDLNWQLGTIYNLVVLLLTAGRAETPPPPKPPAAH